MWTRNNVSHCESGTNVSETFQNCAYPLIMGKLNATGSKYNKRNVI
jgi:hypothetical protein